MTSTGKGFVRALIVLLMVGNVRLTVARSAEDGQIAASGGGHSERKRNASGWENCEDNTA